MTGPIDTGPVLTDEKVAALREPFDPKVVGKLPRVTCQPCSKKNCQEHAKRHCAACGNFISERHIHLDYVGHAEVTDRLLSVDPAWSWEPFAIGPDGGPLVRKDEHEWTLWIRLTVCGVTRIGVGSVAPKSFDAEKQLIGDALRNAAMRFGVALDLWSKTELESQLDEPHEGAGAQPVPTAASEGAPRSPARPCPLCGFDLTDKPVKKQDGQYVHKNCPQGPAPRDGEGAQPASTVAAPPSPQNAPGGAVDGEAPAPPEAPSDDNRLIHQPPEKADPKAHIATARKAVS